MSEDVTEEGTEETPEVVETPNKVDIDTTLDNMGELRKAKEEAEKQAKKDKKDADARVAEAQKALADRDRSDALKGVVGDDEEMGRKVTEEYELLNMPDGTLDEIKARMEKAHKLAQPSAPVMGSEAVSSAGGSTTPSTGSTPDPEMLGKLGITEDRAKSISQDVEAMRARRKNG